MSVPQLLGRYQLRAKLAVGGQSEVWFAVRRGPGGFQRRCALKLLVPPLSLDDAARKAFIAEARLNALFDHPNLLPVTDLGEDPDSSIVFAVMPYVTGISLAKIVRDPMFDGMHMVEALWIVAHVLLALDFAHHLKDERGRQMSIIHRDVSPENVMLGFDGTAWLIDFGIALSSINPRNTQMHVVKGKLDYLSPEQANASHGLDHTTDIYSTGLMLYVLLTGRNPLDGAPDSALQRARNPTIPRVDSMVQLPVELAQVVHGMLSPIPSERPQSAGETGRRLLQIAHKLDPNFDRMEFEVRLAQRLRDDIVAEENFLRGVGEGTQVINTSEIVQKRSRADETTPIAAASDVQGTPVRRTTGAEETRDDLQAILNELEDIYE